MVAYSVKLVRTAFRAFRYCAIHQTDWHADQFLFPPSTLEALEEGSPALVCVDFAVAIQDPCLCHAPVVDDWQDPSMSLDGLGVPLDIMSEHFVERDEHEW